MTDFHKRVPPPNLFATDRGVVAQADAEWESIMVQITLAWVIILGYLMSMGMNESRNLAAETQLQRRQNKALKSIVADFGSTDLGRERTERIRSQRQLQLEQLLRIWWEVRTKQVFYNLLRQFNNAELIPLSDDLPSLPTGPSFQRLNTEIDRIFLSGTDKVSAAEIKNLMADVVQKAGYDPSALDDRLDWEELPPDAAPLYDNQRTPAPENLRMLKLRIVGDLNRERDDLVEIQYALVGKIAATRLDKLAALPLESESDVDVDTPDLARTMLERILTDLRNEMRLLPETADRIRGVSDSTPTGNQE
jgi:hypothetical protein